MFSTQKGTNYEYTCNYTWEIRPPMIVGIPNIVDIHYNNINKDSCKELFTSPNVTELVLEYPNCKYDIIFYIKQLTDSCKSKELSIDKNGQQIGRSAPSDPLRVTLYNKSLAKGSILTFYCSPVGKCSLLDLQGAITIITRYTT
jgi:hypothetical protein